MNKPLPDHTACQAHVQAIYDYAVEIMDSPPGLGTQRDLFEHRLGTAGHLYHREGTVDLIRERDEYRQAALELNAEIRHGLAWVATGAEPAVAHAAMLKTADKWRDLLEDAPAPDEARP